MNSSNTPITRNVMLVSLCVPCENRCRYCLLSYSGRTVGAEWERSAALAKSFKNQIAKARHDLGFDFSFGYSMEHPKLIDAVDFLNSIGSVQGRFMQLDGMKMRSDCELKELFSALKARGVEDVNFTVYGTEAYHDRFAARSGDHDLIMRSMRSAIKAGLGVSAMMPLNGENYLMAEQVLNELHSIGVDSLRFIIPHGEGRGAAMESVRLNLGEFDLLPETVKCRFNREAFKTEGEWCALLKCGKLKIEENRTLIISITPENIEKLEKTPVEQMISDAERLDEEYYAAFPSFPELMEMYGKLDGSRLFSYRDLFHYYRRKYASEHGLDVYDVTDETQTGSRRH